MKLAIALAGLLVAASVDAQPRRISGDRISGDMQIDAKSGMVTETATLSFRDTDTGPTYTMSFVARHPIQEPVAAPGVVDIVVTEQQAEDESPEMTLRVDGDEVPVIARLRGKRSVVASVPLAEFDRIASAGVVLERTFGTELELGPGQIRMLRATADRWLGRGR